ncbi:hypothetical protein [Streptomyces sp. SID13726]|uniref:hypothetical protein n=1 Tax=Streptomyces sp. SID13726 TaxID=2706058 RepID=UPI0013BAC092|nr:hypothetical protein [Streptomyces sp. SID13726]NEB01227.1 hypothetical protein [Streptomyces sp. SID13726]
MAVKAKLEGHTFDLDALVELFREGDPRVSKEEGGYYLNSAELGGLMDNGGRLFEAATNLLQRVTGVARVLDSSFRPVSLPGIFVEDDGTGNRRRHHIVQADTAVVRSKAYGVVLSVSDGQSPPCQPPPPSPPEGPPYMQLASSHVDVAETLEILGRSSVSLTWVDLYKVYEIVRGNVGGDKQLKATQWVSGGDLSAFTASANRPDVSGSEARHARATGTGLPKRTMTLAEGEAFVRSLVLAWWNYLNGQPSA